MIDLRPEGSCDQPLRSVIVRSPDHSLDNELWKLRLGRREVAFASQAGITEPSLVALALSLARIAAQRDVKTASSAGEA